MTEILALSIWPALVGAIGVVASVLLILALATQLVLEAGGGAGAVPGFVKSANRPLLVAFLVCTCIRAAMLLVAGH